MCLIVKGGPYKASRDLFILKLGECLTPKTFLSYHRGFRYQYGRTSRAKMVTFGITSSHHTMQVEEGLHGLIASELYENPYWLADNFDTADYSRGVMLCKIPKGARYYIGERADIVADAMTPIEPLLVNSKTKPQLEGEQLRVIHLSDLAWLDHIIKICKSRKINLL